MVQFYLSGFVLEILFECLSAAVVVIQRSHKHHPL